ncbi:MAG: 50S ribosomal protein L24 [Sumerlaeia bacterium]
MSLIRKGDTIQVITGPYKGERGTVTKVIPKLDKVIVEKINLRAHHEPVRQGKDGEQLGGIIEREAPIHLSNVMFVHKDKPVRLGSKVNSDGSKVRVARGGEFNDEVVDEA